MTQAAAAIAAAAIRTMRREPRAWVVVPCQTARVFFMEGRQVLRKTDFMGAFDYVALDTRAVAIIGVQVTSRPNALARAKKLLANPLLPAWLQAGGRAVVWGMYREGRFWQPRQIDIRLIDGAVTAVDPDGKPRKGSKVSAKR